MKSPCSFIVRSTVLMASFASVFSRSVNCFTSIPAMRAKVAGCVIIARMKFCNAVADISTCCMFWSSVEAKPSIALMLMPACLATPPSRPAKSTR